MNDGRGGKDGPDGRSWNPRNWALGARGSMTFRHKHTNDLHSCNMLLGQGGGGAGGREGENGRTGNPKYFLHINETPLTIFKKRIPVKIMCAERHFRSR